jgi:tRNA modification GTPase
LKHAHNDLETAGKTLQQGLSLEFAAIDVKKALQILGELTGEVFNEDILNAIFSKFCIGK